MDYWKAIGLGLAAAIVTFGAIGYALQKKDIGFYDIDAWISFAKHQIFGDSAAPIGIIEVEKAVVNETVKLTATPTVTPAPSYDYYDKDFKVGIMIEGDPQFKQNVTNLIKTFKQVTPDDYRDLIKYAPKKIMRSPDNFNWYGGTPNDDVIEVTEVTERYGGSDDSKKRLFGVVDIVPELGNAKRSKTGVNFSSVYESELDVNKRFVEYAVKVGVMSKEGADNYIKIISEQLKNGKYFNGAKLNQS